MTHIDIIKEAYDKVGITYVVREDGEYKYLLLCNEKTAKEYLTTDLDTLLRQESFMEFENGKLASY